MTAADLRSFSFMPLYITRLQKSKAWLQCKREPQLAFYLMNLWMRAWHEIPAGSIEDDDDVLADAAMCSAAQWKTLKPKVMRNWTLRDGRFYHPVVTELANEAWAEKQSYNDRLAKARGAKAQKSVRTVAGSITEPVTGTVAGSIIEPFTEPVAEPVAEPVTTLKGQGEIESKSTEANASAQFAPFEPPKIRPEYPIEPTERLWAEGVDCLTAMGANERESRSNIGRWLKSKHDPPTILDAIRRAREIGTREPIGLISRILSPSSGPAKASEKGSIHAAISQIREQLRGGDDAESSRLLLIGKSG